jgi:hypothetical protein
LAICENYSQSEIIETAIVGHNCEVLRALLLEGINEVLGRSTHTEATNEPAVRKRNHQNRMNSNITGSISMHVYVSWPRKAAKNNRKNAEPGKTEGIARLSLGRFFVCATNTNRLKLAP